MLALELLVKFWVYIEMLIQEESALVLSSVCWKIIESLLPQV